jgi:hypothetical protein
LISPTSLISATTCSSSDSIYSWAPPVLKRASQVGHKREPRLVSSLNDQASCRTSTRPSGSIAQRVCLPAGAAHGPSRALPQRLKVRNEAVTRAPRRPGARDRPALVHLLDGWKDSGR